MNYQDHKFPDVIFGDFINFRKVKESDAEFIYELRTSSSAKYLNQPDGYSIESQWRWINSRTGDEVNYIIEDKDDGVNVGMCAIYECDWTNGVSNAGRLLLRSDFVNAGTPYGLEALKMMYSYVFNEMGFRKISGIINVRNEKVYRLQKYLGMEEEGMFKDHILLKGVPQSMYFMSLFKEDFPAYEEKINDKLKKYSNGHFNSI